MSERVPSWKRDSMNENNSKLLTLVDEFSRNRRLLTRIYQDMQTIAHDAKLLKSPEFEKFALSIESEIDNIRKKIMDFEKNNS